MYRLLPIALILMLAGLLIWLFSWDSVEPEGRPAPGGDFVLQSADGEIRLADYRGRGVVIYFGYTGCPDICPTSLAQLAVALKSMPADLQQQIQPIFISVDPFRDTPQRLKAYVGAFHPGMVGLTGSAEVLDGVARQYGVIYRVLRQAGESDYPVDHSSRLYLVGRDGTLRQVLEHGVTSAQISDALNTLIR